MINSKKGVSGIIVTVLLILLAFAAIALIWGFVNPFIQGILEQSKIKSECLGVAFEITEAKIDAITIKRVQGDLDVEKINIFVEGSLKIPEDNVGRVPVIGESITYSFVNDPLTRDNIVTATFEYKGITCGEFGPARVRQ